MLFYIPKQKYETEKNTTAVTRINKSESNDERIPKSFDVFYSVAGSNIYKTTFEYELIKAGDK